MGKFGALSAAAVLILGFGALSGTPAAAATATLKSLSVELDGGAAWTPDVADCTECTSDTNAGDSVAVAPGATITVELEIMGDGSTPWECTEWMVGASTGTDQDPANAAGFGTVTEIFDLTAPAVNGTYDLFLDARANNGCGAGADFGTINLVDAVIVLEWIDQVHARHPNSVTCREGGVGGVPPSRATACTATRVVPAERVFFRPGGRCGPLSLRRPHETARG